MFNGTPPRWQKYGFSLIEIVLALAIISFALIGILGLLPLAMNTATDSQHETQAALIAKSIFSDLNAQTETTRYLYRGSATNSSGNSIPEAGSKIALDLKTSSQTYLGFDANAIPLDQIVTASTYLTGSLSASYLARIQITIPNSSAALSQVEVTVSVPGAAPESARKKYQFYSMIYQGKSIATP